MTEKTAFSIFRTMGIGLRNLKGAKWAIWAPYICYFAGFIVIAPLLGVIVELNGPRKTGSFVDIFIILLLPSLLLIPLVGGIYMTALKKIRGEKVKAVMAFKYWHKWWPLVANRIVYLALLFLIRIPSALTADTKHLSGTHTLLRLVAEIVALLFVVFFVFIFFAILDKNKGPLSAFKTSAKIVAPRWFRMILMLFLAGLFALIAIGLPIVLGFLLVSSNEFKLMHLPFIAVSLVAAIYYVPWFELTIASAYEQLSNK